MIVFKVFFDLRCFQGFVFFSSENKRNTHCANREVVFVKLLFSFFAFVFVCSFLNLRSFSDSVSVFPSFSFHCRTLSVCVCLEDV